MAKKKKDGDKLPSKKEARKLPVGREPMRVRNGRLEVWRPNNPLADRLFATIHRHGPDMPDTLAWKLVAAIIAAIADEKGVDLT